MTRTSSAVFLFSDISGLDLPSPAWEDRRATIATAVFSAVEDLDNDRATSTMTLFKGRAQGLFNGFAEGLAKGRAESVLTVLRARGLTVPDEVRERILTQKDTERLERWLEKATIAPSADAVVDESS